jgi:hypothetical protein
MHFTATHFQCVYHFPEEAFTDRQDHVLIGESPEASGCHRKVYSYKVTLWERLLNSISKIDILKATSDHDRGKALRGTLIELLVTEDPGIHSEPSTS